MSNDPPATGSSTRILTPGDMPRIWAKITVTEPGCWVWTGAVDKWGYALFRAGGRTRVIHKVIWEDWNGPVPSGLELDHTCKNSSCVNPDHLETVTHRENILRGDHERPRDDTGHYVKADATKHAPRPVPPRTHCKRGHEFTPENTEIGWDGMRRCKTCRHLRRSTAA